MKLATFVPIILAFSISGLTQGSSPKPDAPPPTRRDNVQETLHGVTISDPYRWLEDQNSPETRAWITQQNEYTHTLLDAWPGRARLEKRQVELRKVEHIGAPMERHGRLFYQKRAPDQEQFVIYTRQGDSGKEEMLIDPNPMSPDHSHQRLNDGRFKRCPSAGLWNSPRRKR